eukprot:TRINITY_DN6102_c0_g1_i2.p1 TRINITY_DN6102_c0_g1~~TRINITY_DN6102_c0_g1_i2.p1  ORF type:complete len:164 (+),score=24.27 TRINITY_DN6102_c0_g1_i2:103-594(+)
MFRSSLLRSSNGSLRNNSTRNNLSNSRKYSQTSKREWIGNPSKENPMKENFPTHLSPFFEQYEHVVNLPVFWGHMDSFGHLNNVNYMRYFESARMDYFFKLKDHLGEDRFREFMSSNSIGPIAKSVSCIYRSPVTYPDTVKSSLTEQKRCLIPLLVEHWNTFS